MVSLSISPWTLDELIIKIFKVTKIALFAYDFPHRKTHDFIVDLVSQGVNDLVVFGAPFKKISKNGNSISNSLQFPYILSADELCRNLGLKYFKLEHEDFVSIEDCIKKYSIYIGIVAGARILPESTISLFKGGVVNFHPGKIPETSGLDSFFYTLKKNIALGVTTHFIDHKVDSGYFLDFKELNLHLGCSPSDVIENNYQLQRLALKNFLSDLASNSLKPSIINRPAKNNPMSPDEKIDALKRFPYWVASRIRSQYFDRLISACKYGNVDDAQNILAYDNSLIDMSTIEGWTPLIVACHNQKINIVKLLLNAGADPNRSGSNGTTPLMYAKNSLLNKEDVSYDLLIELVKRGANVNAFDSHGKDIFHYIKSVGDERMLKFFLSA